LEYPDGVGSVTEAEMSIETEVLTGATEGVAETPPEFAKVTGESNPRTDKRAAKASIVLTACNLTC